MFTLLTVWILLISCTVNQEKEIPLPGKIAVSKPDGTFVIYDSSGIAQQFQLRDDKISYSGLRWMHSRNSFVGVEYLQTESGRTNQGNVVRFDTGGKIIERIYESERGELAGDTYLSWDDKKLLVTTEKIGNNKDNPLEGLARKQSVMILDLKQKKIIKEIQNIGSSPNLQIEESPWFPDGNRFVYSLTSGRRIINEGEVINPLDNGYAGVYVYDLIKDESKLLTAGAHFAVASPINNSIAYIKKNSIAVLDLNSNHEIIIYEFGEKDKITNIHWTPDGKYLYLAYFHYNLGLSDLFTTGEKLIEVSTGNEVLFNKIGHGFNPYTWK